MGGLGKTADNVDFTFEDGVTIQAPRLDGWGKVGRDIEYHNLPPIEL